MASRLLLSDPACDPRPLRKQQDRPPRARLRILIAGDPGRPMRAITLPRTLPLVASVIGATLVLLTILLACGSWKLSDARSALEHRIRAMAEASDIVALDTAGVDPNAGWAGATNPGSSAGAFPLLARPPSGPLGRFVVQSVNNGEEMEVNVNLATSELDSDSYRQLRHLMRCLHTGAESPVDPRLIDLLYRIAQRTRQKILLVSGFRAPMFSLAKLSYHTRGMAADIRIPGMTPLMARDLAESMGVHGLGYYPVSGFIHVDVRENRIRWIDYGQNRMDGEGTEHGPDHADSAGPAPEPGETD